MRSASRARDSGILTYINRAVEELDAAKFNGPPRDARRQDPRVIVVDEERKPRKFYADDAQDHGYLIGRLEGRIIVDEADDLFSTGAWVSDEWGDLNPKP